MYMFDFLKNKKITTSNNFITKEVKVIKNSKGCLAYNCDTVFYIKLEKGATTSDHSHNHEETIFLIEGEAEVIIGNKTQKVIAPVKLLIPANVYHKFTALTDLIGLEVR